MDTASTEIYTLPLHASLPISTNTGPPVFTVRLWGTAPFQNVVLVKDGTVAFSTSGDRVLSFTYQDQAAQRSEEHTSELQSHLNLVCRLLLEKKIIIKYKLRRP